MKFGQGSWVPNQIYRPTVLEDTNSQLNMLPFSFWSVHGDKLNTDWMLSVPLGLQALTCMREKTELYELSSHMLKSTSYYLVQF